MANSFETDPWIVDSAVTGPLVHGRVYVDRIRWVDPTTVDHKCIVTDKNDKVIVAMTCSVANKDEEVVLKRWFEHGIKIGTRDSGAVHLYRGRMPAALA